jgi:hypothetical protein
MIITLLSGIRFYNKYKFYMLCSIKDVPLLFSQAQARCLQVTQSSTGYQAKHELPSQRQVPEFQPVLINYPKTPIFVLL